MSGLIIIGIILAVLNPVIGGVLVGYIVWMHDQYIGFQIILLSLTVMQLFIITGFILLIKRIKKIEIKMDK